MRIYSHLEHQLTNYQANAVLGAHNFSYLEERVSYCSIEQKMYVMRPLYAPNIQGRIGTGNALLVYQMDKKMPLVQEKHFWCTNKDRTSVSGQWKETVAEQ